MKKNLTAVRHQVVKIICFCIDVYECQINYIDCQCLHIAEIEFLYRFLF